MKTILGFFIISTLMFSTFGQKKEPLFYYEQQEQLVLNETSNEKINEYTTNLLKHIKVNLADNNHLNDSYEKLSQISAKTTKVISTINNLKKEMIIGSGGVTEFGKPTNLTDKKIVQRFMFTAMNGRDLVDQLKKLENDLNPLVLVKDANEIPVLKNDKKYNNKRFLSLHFKDKTLIEALNQLTVIQLRISQHLLRLVQKQSALVSTPFLSKPKPVVDRFLMDVTSNTITAGTKYEAKVEYAHQLDNVVSINYFLMSFPLKVNTLGQAMLSFKASFSGGVIDSTNSNRMRKFYRLKVVLTKSNGEKVKHTKKVFYYVEKPILEGINNQNLYEQSGNFMTILCPQLGEFYHPSFSAQGAMVRKGAKTGTIVVIPSQGVDKVRLKVSSGGIALGFINFNVIETPKPRIYITDENGDSIKIKGAITCPNQIKVWARVDSEYFKQNLPRDFKYRITKGSVQLVRSTRPVSRVITLNGPNVDLKPLKNLVKSGDYLLIEVTEVKRAKYAGGVETIPLQETIIIPVTPTI